MSRGNSHISAHRVREERLPLCGFSILQPNQSVKGKLGFTAGTDRAARWTWDGGGGFLLGFLCTFNMATAFSDFSS